MDRDRDRLNLECVDRKYINVRTQNDTVRLIAEPVERRDSLNAMENSTRCVLNNFHHKNPLALNPSFISLKKPLLTCEML